MSKLLLGKDELLVPTTTKGDLSTFDTSQQRLEVGTNDFVLTADSTEPTGLKWAMASGGGVDVLTTKGDLHTFDSDDQRLAVGDDDFVLTADSAEATGLKWAAASGGTPELIENAGQTASVDVSANNCIVTCGGFERFRVGQFGGIHSGGTNTDKVAQFTSTSSGIVLPRMTETQRDNISGATAGELVYNTTTDKLNFYNGSAWEIVTSST